MKERFRMLGKGLYELSIGFLINAIFLYIFWEPVITNVFPKLVEEGYIKADLTFVDAMLFGILLCTIASIKIKASNELKQYHKLNQKKYKPKY